jgi:hypothetical protein
MSLGNGKPIQYRVDMEATARHQFKRLAQLAKETGQHQQLARQLNAIYRELRNTPLGWSEPYIEYVHLGMKLCIGFFESLCVTFGVDEKNHIVIIKSIRPIKGHFLDQ